MIIAVFFVGIATIILGAGYNKIAVNVGLGCLAWAAISFGLADDSNCEVTEDLFPVRVVDGTALIVEKDNSVDTLRNVNDLLDRNFREEDRVLRKVKGGYWSFGIYYPSTTKWEFFERPAVEPLPAPKCLLFNKCYPWEKSCPAPC